MVSSERSIEPPGNGNAALGGAGMIAERAKRLVQDYWLEVAIFAVSCIISLILLVGAEYVGALLTFLIPLMFDGCLLAFRMEVRNSRKAEEKSRRADVDVQRRAAEQLAQVAMRVSVSDEAPMAEGLLRGISELEPREGLSYQDMIGELLDSLESANESQRRLVSAISTGLVLVDTNAEDSKMYVMQEGLINRAGESLWATHYVRGRGSLLKWIADEGTMSGDFEKFNRYIAEPQRKVAQGLSDKRRLFILSAESMWQDSGGDLVDVWRRVLAGQDEMDFSYKFIMSEEVARLLSASDDLVGLNDDVLICDRKDVFIYRQGVDYSRTAFSAASASAVAAQVDKFNRLWKKAWPAKNAPASYSFLRTICNVNLGEDNGGSDGPDAAR